jgi:hypothetical protein
VVALLMAVLAATRAQEPATWRVLIEPKFMKAAVVRPIAGAQRAELVAATVGEAGVEYLSRAQFDALKIDWEAFTAQALTNANAELDALKIETVRDRRKVITHAIVRSEHGLVASAVLAPKFLDLFKDTLGDKVLVVIPNRSKAYVFPGLASDYQEFAPAIFEAYHATAYPVSVEVFELSKDGLKAVGIFEEP